MNKNIEVINENLWAVNYNYVKVGYIQELTFNHMDNPDRLACITNDGKIVLNKEYDYSVYVPFLEAVMNMDDSELDTKHGFCNVIRTLTKHEEVSDQEIMKMIWSDSTLTMNWTIYQNLCNWERARRKAAKEYCKKHPFKVLYMKIRKGVKNNGKHSNINSDY